jgi:hypothetical protein
MNQKLIQELFYAQIRTLTEKTINRGEVNGRI